MAKALMIQGTGSGAGKSLLVAALCRIFKDSGVNAAPFKAQNMALNSYITFEGGEIGKAQALQAEAARIEPTVDMNPILLKASGEAGSQVIIHGKVHSTMKVREYYAFKKTAWAAAKESFDRLSKKHELIIMEGAGSPAEINLMDVDIVNMSIAKHAKAPVILVGDIDKGGVFAALYGTVKLLGKDSRHIKAYVINKFRGDMEILRPGLDMISEKTGIPMIGVLPYINNIDLPEEDGLSLQGSNSKFKIRNSKLEKIKIKIVILHLQYISNFTDFDPFMHEPDVEIVYSRNSSEIENADMVIIPGSKNTVKDLMFLKEARLDESIKRAFSKGIQIMGMCGGYQMLGKKIYDPHGIESSHKEVAGLGFLNIETTFEKEKTTCQIEGELVRSSEFGVGNNGLLRGYEIHMGTSSGDIGLFKLRRLSSNSSLILDGSINGNCWGTYIHGIFENDSFRRGIINFLREQRKLPPIDSAIKYSEMKEKAIDALADIVKQNLDMDFINRIIGL
ncbi:MAG: cobyric acid synthase CobQ [Nitrospirae bacterium GWF2_44_13]|nr:MAG: cobyric acid synthase CobQ [Nitrospirae bacterium GWF2_44_13]OGW64837.1 MAG: cobyric acid synthase CobQ [Nitrospirae bacterium RIFOXYA2_FULL_44_9]HBG91911.1 cobyric acid synthase CobQ [Nitrospiraceae bacterium]